MIVTIPDVKHWINQRLEAHRRLIETPILCHESTLIARGRIAELKELLADLDAQDPPRFEDAE